MLRNAALKPMPPPNIPAMNPNNAGLAPPSKTPTDFSEVQKYIDQQFAGRHEFQKTVENVKQSNTEATPQPASYVSPADVEELGMVDEEGNEYFLRNDRGMWQFNNQLGQDTGVRMNTDEAMKMMERFDEDTQRKAFAIMRVDVPTVERDPRVRLPPEAGSVVMW
jgi:hypothetical protein